MFQHLLREQTVRLPLEATTREAAFAELVALLPSGLVPSAKKRDLLDLLIQREMFESSGIGDGVALSHAVVSGITEPVAVLGISRRGFSCPAPDQEPVHFVFLAFFPDTPEFRARKFSILGFVESFFRDAFLRERLKIAERAEEAYEVLVRECHAMEQPSRVSKVL